MILSVRSFLMLVTGCDGGDEDDVHGSRPSIQSDKRMDKKNSEVTERARPRSNALLLHEKKATVAQHGW